MGILEGVALLWHAAGVPVYVSVNLAVWAGLHVGIHGYTLVWQKLVSPRDKEGSVTPTMFLIGAAAALGLISSVWYALSGFYPRSCTLLASNIHGQDLLICVLAAVTGFACLEIKDDGKIPALFISWLLPMSALYFTTETKMLAHLEVGTPFHPSWHARGLAPVWGGYQVVNATFWLATFFLTAFGTSVTFAFIAKYTNCWEGWMMLLFQGALMLFVSGWFMAIFITGLPPPLDFLQPSPIQPAVPTASKGGAVFTHKKDLQIGLFFMGVAPVAKRYLPEDTSKFSVVVVAVGWLLFVIGKVRLFTDMPASLAMRGDDPWGLPVGDGHAS